MCFCLCDVFFGVGAGARNKKHSHGLVSPLHTCAVHMAAIKVYPIFLGDLMSMRKSPIGSLGIVLYIHGLALGYVCIFECFCGLRAGLCC